MHVLRKMTVATGLVVSLSGAALAEQLATAADESFPVHIRVDANAAEGQLAPIWRFFGADEPNYATMKDGRKLLGELGELRPDAVYFRAHNLLTSGDGTPALKWGSSGAYREDKAGRPQYDWTILDRIFDTYRQCGVRPLVEVGFMPRDLSTHPEPYRHHWRETDPYERIFTGWSYPPKDYARWGELVYQWARHCVERYGADEGGHVVLGGLERGEYPLLGRLKAGFLQAARLHGQRGAPGPAQCPGRRTAHGRGRRPVPPRLSRTLAPRQELRHGPHRLAARLHRLPRQGLAPRGRGPRSHGHRQPAPHD